MGPPRPIAALVVMLMIVATTRAAVVSVPCCSLATLRAYIANASDGTAFQLAQGTFTGCPMVDSTIDVMAGNHSFTYQGDPSGTVIDCGGSATLGAVKITNPNADTRMAMTALTIVNCAVSSINVSDPRPSAHAFTLVLDTVTVFNQTFASAVTWSANGNLTVVNSAFRNITNPSSRAAGGAIAVNASGASIVIQSVQFSGCSIAGSGGVINVGGANSRVAITNSTFLANTAGFGGAGFLSGTSMVYIVDVSMFQANRGTGGGALYLYGGSNTFIIRGTQFTGNWGGASHDAGAILALAANTQYTFANVSFVANSAPCDGGAVYMSAASISVSFNGGAFVGNSAGHSGGGLSIESGVTNSNISVIGTTFQSNTAGTFHGGGMYCGGTDNTVVFMNNTVTANWVPSIGAGLVVVGTRARLSLKGNRFTLNTAATGGGVACASTGGRMTIDGDTFTSNIVTSSGGGVLVANIGSLLVTGSTFLNNTSTPTNNGGGLACSTAFVNGTLTVENSTFYGNTGLSGGAMFLQGVNSTFTVRGCNATGNNAGTNVGGGILAQVAGGSFFLLNTQIVGNQASQGGGVFTFINQGGRVLLDGNAITDNVLGCCVYKGGGLFIGTDTVYNVNVSNTLFARNNAPQNGGGMYMGPNSLVSGVVNFNNVTFTGNSAGNAGGGFYQEGPNTNYSFTNCVFTQNTAVLGGAVALASSYHNTIFTTATLSSNSATYGAGLFAKMTQATLVMSGGVFSTNSATNNGGALHFDPLVLYSSIQIMGTNFTGNTAVHGAGMYTDGANNSIVIDGANFISGRASANGGGIGSEPNSVNFFTVSKTNFQLNSASQMGGAMYAQCVGSSTVTFDSCAFTSNTGANGGGAIALAATGKTAVVRSSQFSANSASTGGAAGIYQGATGASLLVANSTFLDHFSVSGGAAITQDHANPMTIAGCTFTRNSAAGNGASVKVTGGTVQITSSSFSNGNVLTGSGGAFYGDSGIVLSINGSFFVKNTCSQNGGGVYVDGKTTLSATQFYQNSAGFGGALYAATGGTQSIVATPDCYFAANNLTGGAFPFEVAVGNLGCTQLPASPTYSSFPYKSSGCSGLVGVPCMVECPPGKLVASLIANVEGITCPTAQGVMTDVTCVSETLISTQFIANNVSAATAPRYGTQGVWSPSNLISFRQASGVATSVRYPNWALVMGGTGMNENNTKRLLDDTWLIDTSDYVNPKFIWVAGSRNTYGSVLFADTSINFLGERLHPQLWIDESTAFLYAGLSSGQCYADIWTLNMDNMTDGWRYSATGSRARSTTAIFGPRGIPSASSQPGGRLRATIFQMPDLFPRAAFMYGGGMTSSFTGGDLWMLNCSSFVWTWFGGPTIFDPPPSYGALGVAGASNWPGARQQPGMWVVGDVVYLFGGIEQTHTYQYNDLWSATYDAGTNAFIWTWISGPKHPGISGVNMIAVRGPLYQFCSGCVPSGRSYYQYMFSPELAAGGLDVMFAYGGMDTLATYGDVWGLRPGVGGAWLSGHQAGVVANTWVNPFPFNATSITTYGSPGPRENGVVWPDHTRHGDFYIMGGYTGDGTTNEPPEFYRMSVLNAIVVTTPNIGLVNGVANPARLNVSLMMGTDAATAVSTTRVRVSASGITNLTYSALVDGSMTILFSVTSPINGYFSLVTVTLTINDRLTTTFNVNVTCPNHCDTCSATSVPLYCQACDAAAGLRYIATAGRCLCNTTAGLGRVVALPGTTCIDCINTPGLYLVSDAFSAECQPCTPVDGCLSGGANLTCTGVSNSRCARCQSGFYRLRPGSSADVCVPCTTTCGSNQFIDVPCSLATDRTCAPCTSCAVQFPGTYQSLPCANTSLTQDTVCTPCTPIDGCVSGQLSCSAANASICGRCAAGRYLLGQANGSDACPVCAGCEIGTFTLADCTTLTPTRCRACDVGCAACSDSGLTHATCSACNETLGWGWNVPGTACVNSCPIGYFMAPRNLTNNTPAQCTLCTPGCAACEGPGLALVSGICTSCNETAGFLEKGDRSACVSACGVGFFANLTAQPNFCQVCGGATCRVGQYRDCDDPLVSYCYDCTPGCADCLGPGINTREYCVTCDSGMAPSEADGTCVPCASNCTTCSTSPSVCVTCADGYANPPYCTPVCESVGCISCQLPGACLTCEPTFVGGDCMKCGGLAQVGTTYPNCIAARETDGTSTGAVMGILAVLCVIVTIVALMKPLPVFYNGEQVVKTPTQDIPLDVDFVLSSKRLELTLTPEAAIAGATLEGVGLLPGATPFSQSDDKGPYSVTMLMTQKQTNHFLAREMRVEVKHDAGGSGGQVTTRHVLAVPLRMTAANILAVVTIVLDFIQLSSFGFSSSVSWWHSDPVPSSLHYTLIQLPPLNNLWFIAYWVLVGLAALWTILVIVLKSGLDAKLSKYAVFKAASAPIYDFLMPLVGQTLYLPILSTMLGALACSRPVTDPSGHFVANFDESLLCWNGDHWLYVIVSAIILAVYYPLAVYTSPLWQTINVNLDVRYFPTFLIVSGQMKFVLSLTAQLFAKVPFLLSALLIVLPIPVVILTLRRPPSVIGTLRWPIAASYASVTWSGIASVVALLYPDVWYTSIILYAGWATLLAASLIAASRKPTHEDLSKKKATGVDAMRRVLAGTEGSGAGGGAAGVGGKSAAVGATEVPHGEAVDVVTVPFAEGGGEEGTTPPVPSAPAPNSDGIVAEEMTTAKSETSATRKEAALK